MDSFDRLEDKLDRLDIRLDDMSGTLIENTMSLQEHIRRTNLLEDYVKAELHPLKQDMIKFKYGAIGIMWACGVLAGALGVYKILQELGVF